MKPTGTSETLVQLRMKRCRDENLEELDDEAMKHIANLQKRKSIVLMVSLSSPLFLEGANFLGTGLILRVGNVHRDRSIIIRWCNELDDVMFSRQFRLCREDFYYVIIKISSSLLVVDQQAINSSGSSVSVQLMLMITLRILAGASYLDMIHYHVHIDSVSKILWKTVSAIQDNLNNIKLPSTNEEFLAIAKVWSDIQTKRWGSILTGGTILAGDGLVIEIEQPSLASLRGRPISIFRNRKSMWGLIVQAFCDAHTKFHVFDISWPGGTNDIVAYSMTDNSRISSRFRVHIMKTLHNLYVLWICIKYTVMLS